MNKFNGVRLAFERDFILLLGATALPVALQSLMASSRTLADILMTSHLGTDEVAAIGYGGRIIFVILLAIMGMTSGGAVLMAQYWGSKNVEKVRQALGITLLLSTGISLLAYLLCFFGADWLVGIATNNQGMADLSVHYIRVASSMIIPMAVNLSFAVALRSIGQAKASTIFSLLGLLLNVLLNYVMIFGHWGFPALGLAGAAWATLLSTLAEAVAVYIFIYGRSHLLAFKMRDVVNGIRCKTYVKICQVGIPSSLSYMAWAIGVWVYSIIVGRMGTQELAALSLITPIESIVIAFYLGISTGASVLVGHSLGSNSMEKAWIQAKALILWSGLVALLGSVLIYLTKDWVLSLFGAVDQETIEMAREVIVILACITGFKALNVTIIVGLLRSGGDTGFCLGMDLFSQWGVGIVLAYLAAFVWHLPLPMVFLAISSEEMVKIFICSYRLLSRKWMRNLVAATTS